MNKKYIWAAVGLIALALIAFGLAKKTGKKPGPDGNPLQTEGQKIKIMASFYPLAHFAENIGGSFVEVSNITPSGAEPHEYEPTARQIAEVYNAKMLIINGNGVDAWAEKIQSDLESRAVAVVKMSDRLDSLKNNGGDEEGQYDPHFWLDPILAQKEVDIIAEALIKIDPARAKEYNQNRDNFKKQLADLDGEYKTGLAACKQNTIVTSHNAFNYLASRYNLHTLYILGLSTEEEPSPKTIAEVADAAKSKGIKYIFFETLVDPKLSETIAKEIGAQTLVLNPIEGLNNEEIEAGKNYISVMKDNLANLKLALACQ